MESRREMRAAAFVCILWAASCFAAAPGDLDSPRGSGTQTAPSSMTFNGPALKVNTQIVSIREVETVFSDSYVLLQDKLRKGEIPRNELGVAIRGAWTEALETATQDKVLDQRADKRRKEIILMYVGRAGGDMGGERALEYFRREEQDCIRRLRRELITAAGGEAELALALKRRGQTMQEWESGLSRELFRRDVLALELGPIARSPAAARAFYDKHPDMFKENDGWRLRRIRIAKDKFKSPEVALEAAKMVKAKIAGGTDFGELAAKVSDDGECATAGGLLTRGDKADLPSGSFLPEERIADGLADGGVSDPVDGGAWYLIVQRVGYRPLAVQTFEQASDRAEVLAYSEKLKVKKRELFEKLKGESYIEVLQKDPPEHILKTASVPATGAPSGDFLPPGK